MWCRARGKPGVGVAEEVQGNLPAGDPGVKGRDCVSFILIYERAQHSAIDMVDS